MNSRQQTTHGTYHTLDTLYASCVPLHTLLKLRQPPRLPDTE
ncbi:MAG TPA: hypothetical protein VH117_11255 [Edaphobacter sp.]|nr:hypothetical protein [Edaphobacter sp.]